MSASFAATDAAQCSAESFTLPSFAKINWTLRVLNRRADGYHNIDTVFQTVTLHDALRFAPAGDGELHLACDAPLIPVDENNLIWRAADALRKRYGVRAGASIFLEKRLPSPGGLGGGSSNAAVALLGLARLWNISLTKRELAELGASLGADVPFFFTGGTARGLGLGTDISLLADAPAAHLLIITPDVKVSTAAAYKAIDEHALTKAESDIILSSSRAGETNITSLLDSLCNDFEPVVFSLYPEVLRVKKALIAHGARAALLAGSGGSVFAVFDNRATRDQSAKRLQAEKNWHVFNCATLPRADYINALGVCAEML